MARNQKDYFYHKAKNAGYRSRASYKLDQINKKHNVIKPGDSVVDLGAAPGGWLQMAKELSGGRVVGVDLQKIKPLEGVQTIKGDITRDTTLKKIEEIIGEHGADVVICDAAPNLTGSWELDHGRSIGLSESALAIAKKLLRPGGNFVVKVFQGDMFKDFLDEAKENFVYLRSFTPRASRKESAEIYVVGKKFLSTLIKKGQEYDVEILEIGEQRDGIARVGDFVVFVPNTKVGQHVRVQITDVKPNFAFADIVE
ncbi:MAG: Ribosomal RNA large subunit methyltransferase E [Candidatus Methanocomedens sp.]|nr:MAG: Ribosomal RNA large subunit methyltransferase E [ANME-2 cluster archaeon]